MRENWKWRAIAVGAAAVLALGACSDDDDTSGSDPGTTAEASDTATAIASFCVVISDVGLGVSIGEGDADSEAAFAAAEQAAPEEISDDVATMAKEARAQVAAGPRPENAPPKIPSDDFFEATTSVGDYMADHCGYQVIDVTATNYAYAGIPASAKARRTLIRLTNKGTEYHEIIVQRVHDGETRSIKQILALPEKEGGDLLDYLGNAFAPPGLSNWTVVDLTPGRHVAMCAIPTGSTPEALHSGHVDDTAPWHARKGMFAEMQIS